MRGGRNVTHTRQDASVEGQLEGSRLFKELLWPQSRRVESCTVPVPRAKAAYLQRLELLLFLWHLTGECSV